MKKWQDEDFKLLGDFLFPSEEQGVTYEVLSKETELLETVKPFLSNNKVMVQAGGNVGMQLLKFAEYFDYVYTFEPEPKNFNCLNKNVNYKNVIKFQACLGEKHELQDLSIWGNEKVLECGGFHVGGNKPYIPTLTIDDLALQSCDFIQLDVEGYELFALRGAALTIEKYKPVICIEQYWIERYGHSLYELKKYLIGLGYYLETTYTTDYIYTYQKLKGFF